MVFAIRLFFSKISLMNTVLLLKRETSSSYKSSSTPISGFVGYGMKVYVDTAYNIVPEIFVMQRDVNSSYTDGVCDTLYSVASVDELESIPPNAPDPDGSNFFRVSSLEMVFKSPQDLDNAWSVISQDVLSLATANDLLINTSPDVVAMYPADAFPRYYGNTTATPSGSDLTALQSDTSFSTSLTASETSSGSNYYSFCYPATIGTSSLSVNGTSTATNFSTVTLTNKYGAPVLYNVYTTTTALASGSNSIVFVGA